VTLRDLLASLRKHLLLVVATTLVTTLGVGFLSSLAAEVYRSSAALHFTLGVGTSASDFNQGATYTQNQMLSFAQLATFPVVLDPVIERLDLPSTAQRLSRSVTVSRPQETTILEISATSGSPDRAAAIANAVAAELITFIEEEAQRDADGNSAVKVRLVKEALPSAYPIAPNTRRNVLAAFVIGVLAGGLVAYLRDVLDTRVRRPEDVAAVVDVPVLGQVSRMPSRLHTHRAVGGEVQAEEFRRIRTNLRFLSVDTEGLCLVLSSAMQGEGKTTACVNLALALAEADMRVLIVDADMRRPQVANRMGLEGSAGLTTVLIGRAAIEDVIQPWGSHRVDVLTSGEVPPNPSELVATRALRDLIGSVRSTYDVVLIDAPPLLPVADAAVLSKMASGVVLVADTKRLRRHQLHEVVDGVHAAGGHVLGVVLNRVKVRRQAAYGYSSREMKSRPAAENDEGGETRPHRTPLGPISPSRAPEVDDPSDTPSTAADERRDADDAEFIAADGSGPLDAPEPYAADIGRATDEHPPGDAGRGRPGGERSHWLTPRGTRVTRRPVDRQLRDALAAQDARGGSTDGLAPIGVPGQG